MVSLQEVRDELKTIKRLGPDLVAVFVGGTSGIGEGTAREFVRYSLRPRIYLVGRSQEQADKLKTEFQSINSDCQTHFIQGDVSLLRNVDRVCQEIKASEEKINLLFLSAGMLTMKGRDETVEGLDKKFSLHYYSRLRFTQNLLPLLNKAASDPHAEGTSKPIARVFSVLGAGLEGNLNMTDLSLKNGFTLGSCATHAITMTSLNFDRLAALNPNVHFVQTQPGGVQTNILRDFNRLAQTGAYALSYLMKPWMQTQQESGERHTFAATTERYRAGAILLGPKSDQTTPGKAFERLKSDGSQNKVAEHTEKVFKDICESVDGVYNGD